MTAVDRPAKGICAAEFERRFKARILERLQPFKVRGHKGSGWTKEQAESMAQSEWEAIPAEGMTDDPEGEADESLSYWGDGA